MRSATPFPIPANASTPRSRDSRLVIPGSFLGAFVPLLALLAACSGRHPIPEAQTNESIQECDAYLTAYEHCLNSLGPAQIAQARVEQTRAGFATQAARGEAARAALRKQCVGNLAQIKTTCR